MKKVSLFDLTQPQPLEVLGLLFKGQLWFMVLKFDKNLAAESGLGVGCVSVMKKGAFRSNFFVAE